MSIFRVEKEKGYTVMSNYHLRDLRLSNKAIGLLSKILSLPEDWDYTTKGLAKISKDGLDSIKSAIKELEEAGYIIRNKVRESGRFSGVDYIIYEKPRSEIISIEKKQSLKEKLQKEVSYNDLVASGLNKKILDELIEVMEEMLRSKEGVIISGKRQPENIIRERIIGLRKEHLETVYCTVQSKKDLINRREYIKAVLFNAITKPSEKKEKRPSINGGTFFNFEQREVSDEYFKDLEKRIAVANSKRFGGKEVYNST